MAKQKNLPPSGARGMGRGITRSGFVKGVGAGLAGATGIAMGLGGVGRAQAPGQTLDDYVLSHELFFSTTSPGTDGGLFSSATKYHYVTCANRELSPIPNDVPSESPIDKWVKSAGDFILIPDFTSPYFVKPIFWDMDPVTGFTEAKMLEMLDESGGIILLPAFNPVGVEIALRDLAGLLETQYTAGVMGSEIPQTIINDIPEVPRPADFDSELIASLDPKTTVVEFTVPASLFQEYGLKQVVAQYMKQIIKTQLEGEGYPAVLAELLAGAHIFQQSPFLVKIVGWNNVYGTPLPIVAPADPLNTYKLRGWFIEGDGIADEYGQVHKPLILFSHGWSQAMTGEREQCQSHRKMIYYLVMQGYSILFYDQEAHGISEGWNRAHNYSPASAGVQLYAPGLNPENKFEWLPYPGPVYIPNPTETGNAVNIFHILNQLSGNPTIILIPDGNGGVVPTPFFMKSMDPEGAIHDGNALIEDATITPTILYGISQGALMSVKAMQLRFETPGGLFYDYSGYNIRGIIDSDCIGASIKFISDAMGASLGWHMAAEGFLRSIFDTMSFSDGDIHGSIPSWPGYLGLKGIYDYMSPDGVVAAYNRARGFKDIMMVKGWHDWGLLFEPNFSYTIKTILKFCRQVTLNDPDWNNFGTTSMKQEICKAPEFDLKMLGEPPFQGKLFGARNSLERLTENIAKQMQ